jgi:hypothetical protein
MFEYLSARARTGFWKFLSAFGVVVCRVLGCFGNPLKTDLVQENVRTSLEPSVTANA